MPETKAAHTADGLLIPGGNDRINSDPVPVPPSKPRNTPPNDQNPWSRILLAVSAPIGTALRCISAWFRSNEELTAYINLISGGIGALFIVAMKTYFKLNPEKHKKFLRKEQQFANSWSRSYKTGAIVAGYAAILMSGLLTTFVGISYLTSFLMGLAISGMGAFGAYYLREQWHTRKRTKRLRFQLYADDFEDDNPLSRSCKSSAILGNAIGALITLYFFPAATWLNIAFGGAMGGLAGGLFGFCISPIYRKIVSSSFYQNLYPESLEEAEEEENSSINNPWSVRIRGGMQWGASWGALFGTLIFPGLGAAIGTSLGTLFGAAFSLMIEPIRNNMAFFKKFHVLRTANPWSARLRTGSYIGTFAGALCSIFIPAAAPVLITAIGGIIGGMMGVISEPLYLYLFYYKQWSTLLNNQSTPEKLQKVATDLKPVLETIEGNPLNAQVSVLAALCSAIGFFIPLPGSAAIGGLIGAFLGGMFCYLRSKRPPSAPIDLCNSPPPAQGGNTAMIQNELKPMVHTPLSHLPKNCSSKPQQSENVEENNLIVTEITYPKKSKKLAVHFRLLSWISPARFEAPSDNSPSPGPTFTSSL